MNKHTHLLPAQDRLRTSLNIVSALAHPLRLDILNVIGANQELSVSEIHKALKIEQALASQQLRILRLAQLVKTRRAQKFIYYSLNYSTINLVSGKVPALAAMIEQA